MSEDANHSIEPAKNIDKVHEDLQPPHPKTNLMPNQTSRSSIAVYRKVASRPWYYYRFQSSQIHFKIGMDQYIVPRSRTLCFLSHALNNLFLIWGLFITLTFFTVTNSGFTGFWSFQLFRFPDPTQAAYDVFMNVLRGIWSFVGILLFSTEGSLYFWEKRQAKQKIPSTPDYPPSTD